MKEPWKSTVTHSLLALPIYGIALAVAVFLPAIWVAAFVNSLYWFSREFAQSSRASNPTKIIWGWTHTLNFAIPTLTGFLLALLIFIL